MPDRLLVNAVPGQPPLHTDVQQLIECERGEGKQGVRRSWQASDSNKVVLTSTAGGVKISRDNGVTAPQQVVVDGTAAGGQLAGTYPNPSLSTSTVDLLLPAGIIWPYAGATVPTGWLLCDGSPRATASFPKLFAAIGYAYGGVGATFNLPDLRGRVLLGASGTHARGTIGGDEKVLGPSHTHPGSHSHDLNSHTHGPGTHTHGLNSHTHGPGAHTHGPGLHTHGTSVHTHDAGSHAHDIAGHTHGAGTHTHTMALHTHDMAGHLHVVNLAHEHMTSHPTASGVPVGINGLATAGGVNLPTTTHTHTYDTPALGTTNVNSGTSGTAGYPTTAAASPNTGDTSAGNTGTVNVGGTSTGTPTDGTGTTTPGAPASGTPSAADTGTPSAADTVAATGSTAGPSAAATDATPVGALTAADNSAYGASYGATTVATMPPFVVGAYIIWAGA